MPCWGRCKSLTRSPLHPAELQPPEGKAPPQSSLCFHPLNVTLHVFKSTNIVYLIPAPLLLIVNIIWHNWGVEITRRQAEIS